MKKKNNTFPNPYLGIQEENGMAIVYNLTGEMSVSIEITNLAEQYSANAENYVNTHMLFSEIIKTMGVNAILQKTDVIYKSIYNHKEETKNFLSKKYHEHFQGREYYKNETYITVTQPPKKGKFFTYDEELKQDFIIKTQKIFDSLNNKKAAPRFLSLKETKEFQRKAMTMNFNSNMSAVNNFKVTDTHIEMGEMVIRNIALIDVDTVNLPSSLPEYKIRKDITKNFPVDYMDFLLEIPHAETIVYNQVISVPHQRITTRQLELKQKRHSSIPDAGNTISMEDIDSLLQDVAKDGSLLVNSHYNILYKCKKEHNLTVFNFIESKLFNIGIIPSAAAYNQLELFRTCLPGNSSELQQYDKFMTTSDAAICFFFKERLTKSEQSHFKMFFTDRQGVPIAIDPSEMPLNTGRTKNRNKFVLGPSGSGKSFTVNSYAMQFMNYDADVVIVDTGHSYSSICEYFKGVYITYTDEKPITTNPFIIDEKEYNEEKREFMKSLIGLLWKGAGGSIDQIENVILGTLIDSYYTSYFSYEHDKRPKVCFNHFYEYALVEIPKITEENGVHINFNEFKFILKQFYQGGQYDKLLNSNMEGSLFNEKFIVFEIDSIKEHMVLFPIITVIIMDVFLQKMRHKSNPKTLIIEEAWKAIASPMMAGYLLYLFKTVRKFDGEVMVVTQELDDILGNAIVKNSILANSDTIILQDQGQFMGKYDEIAALLNLDEIEQNKIFTINRLKNKDNRPVFKETYIKRGLVGEVYGVEVSMFEYIAFSTKRSEKEAFQKYLKFYGDFETAIETFVSDFKNSKQKLEHFVIAVKNNKNLIKSQPQQLIKNVA